MTGPGRMRSSTARGSAAPEPSWPGAGAARTTTGSSTPWSGASSRAASGASSTRHFTSWNVAGARLRRAPLRSAEGHGRATERQIRDARRRPRRDRPLRGQHPLRPDPLDGDPSLDRHRLPPGVGRRNGPRARPGAIRPGRPSAIATRRTSTKRFLTALEAHAGEIVFQFSFGAEPLPFETASRLSQRTIGQVAEMIGRHPAAAVPVFSGQPACQPVDVHAGAGVAELQPGRLLVAQLLSRHDRPGHARAARHGAGQQAGRVSFPTPTASNGLMPRRSWCGRSWHGSWPSGSSSGSSTAQAHWSSPGRSFMKVHRSLLGMVAAADD